MDSSLDLRRGMKRVLTEASGGLTAGYILKAVAEAGAQGIASDIEDLSYADAFGAEFLKVPASGDELLWEKMASLVSQNKIDIVIPSLDETLLGWSKRQEEFSKLGCQVIISPKKTIEVCQDKWKTYQFFVENNIPTPLTSLSQLYPLVKPRDGRGGRGIINTLEEVDMTNMISQEVLSGVEYTIDVLFDHLSRPVYIIPRRRIGVVDGKSTKGIVEKNEQISDYIVKMSKILKFYGPINFQCFIQDDAIKFLEINPRVAGGMALGFAASENWIMLIINNILNNIEIRPKEIKYGLTMLRYYGEHFVPRV
jgi:carbamoyl-phosphate synthase large subunit